MPDEVANATPIETPPQPDTPPVQETVSKEDRQMLEFAKMRRMLALKEAEKVLSQNECAEAEYKNIMLQLYLKYNLRPETDQMDDKGNITRNKPKEVK
jgi:hypothetical protein